MSAKIGLALGGGGARGLAHIAILEAFDEAGVKPATIAGTSIGALIGAAYASGMPAVEIRRYCAAAFGRRSAIIRHVYSRWRSRGVWDIWRPWAPALFRSERIFELVLPPGLPKTFDGLKIPFMSVATDFFTQSQYVSTAGTLLPALAASSALPALLTPVKLDGRILIDGGYVNPLPFDLLSHADFVMAVDVSGQITGPETELPRPIETLLGAQQIALRSIINAKLKLGVPDCLLRPDVGHFPSLDFARMDEILAAAADAKKEAAVALAKFTANAKLS